MTEWLLWLGGMFLFCVMMWYLTAPIEREVERAEEESPPQSLAQYGAEPWKPDLDKYR
jgi:hypothetical protein